MFRKTVACIGFAIAGLAQAVTVNCNVTSARTTYAPTQQWPFDTVAVIGQWAPFCGNFTCASPPAIIGATAKVQGSIITLDMYASDGAPLPNGVPTHLVTEPVVAIVQAVVGPLAPGSYTLATRAHIVDASGTTLVCGPVASAVALSITQAVGLVERLTAIEFHNTTLDHYFVSADPAEIADLDNRVHPGWSRTGQSFRVYAPLKSGGRGTPVCRFYGLPSAGLDSHFYTADQAECAAIPAKFRGAWQLESANSFDMWPPDSNGQCSPGFVPVNRLWNQRVDSNHRFTTDVDIANEMRARGYFWEGQLMCSPQ